METQELEIIPNEKELFKPVFENSQERLKFDDWYREMAKKIFDEAARKRRQSELEARQRLVG